MSDYYYGCECERDKLFELSKYNYYQVYFLTKEQIDMISPLKISPIRPDNVMRVMLTARGLDKPIKLNPQILPPKPMRSGFTVVEWGGAILK